MAITYDSIVSTTLGSSQNTVTFSGISSAYTDLRLVLFLRNDRAGTGTTCSIRFNNISTSTYDFCYLQTFGTTTQSGTTLSSTMWNTSLMNVPAASSETNLFSAHYIDIMDYTNSYYKTMLMEATSFNTLATASDTTTGASVLCWRNTAAINRIDVICGSSANFVAGSTFALYGIARA